MPPINVLLVEDSADDILLMEQLVESSGLAMRLIVRSDGVSALDYLLASSDPESPSDSIQIVLLDLSLPRLNGMEVLQRLKTTPALADIPVIILSDTEDEGHIRRGQQLRAHTHIAKPLSMYELTWIVDSAQGYWRRMQKLNAIAAE